MVESHALMRYSVDIRRVIDAGSISTDCFGSMVISGRIRDQSLSIDIALGLRLSSHSRHNEEYIGAL